MFLIINILVFIFNISSSYNNNRNRKRNDMKLATNSELLKKASIVLGQKTEFTLHYFLTLLWICHSLDCSVVICGELVMCWASGVVSVVAMSLFGFKESCPHQVQKMIRSCQTSKYTWLLYHYIIDCSCFNSFSSFLLK